jgi:hypothetical protein
MEGRSPTTNINLLDDDYDDDNNNNLKRPVEHFHEILSSNDVTQIKEELIYQGPVLNTQPATRNKVCET